MPLIITQDSPTPDSRISGKSLDEYFESVTGTSKLMIICSFSNWPVRLRNESMLSCLGNYILLNDIEYDSSIGKGSNPYGR
jgi:hypothetical protein